MNPYFLMYNTSLPFEKTNISCCYSSVSKGFSLAQPLKDNILKHDRITYFSNIFSSEPFSSKVTSVDEADCTLSAESAVGAYERNESNGSGAVLEEESEDHDLARRD